MWAAVTVISLVILSGLYGLIRRPGSSPLSLDAQVVAQLRRAGSDVSRPHKVDFFLLFTSEQSAKGAAVELTRREFQVDGAPTQRQAVWTCQASRLMVPKESELQQLRSELSALAHTYGGTYDGWGAEVVNK